MLLQCKYGLEINNTADIANHSNRFFCKVGHTFADQINCAPSDKISAYYLRKSFAEGCSKKTNFRNVKLIAGQPVHSTKKWHRKKIFEIGPSLPLAHRP